MDKAPAFPSKFLFNALAVLADIAGLICVFVSNLPLGLKLGIGSVMGLVPAGVILFYLGERRGWVRQRRRLARLETECDELHRRLEAQRSASPYGLARKTA